MKMLGLLLTFGFLMSCNTTSSMSSSQKSRVITTGPNTGTFSTSDGPARLNIFAQPGQDGWELYLNYSGQLFVGCEDQRSINVHLIFYESGRQKIFIHKMKNFCSQEGVNPSTKIAQFYSFKGFFDHFEMWPYISRYIDDSSVKLEVAFEKDGKWDSNLDKNYKLD
jgi:hypothetical protein